MVDRLPPPALANDPSHSLLLSTASARGAGGLGARACFYGPAEGHSLRLVETMAVAHSLLDRLQRVREPRALLGLDRQREPPLLHSIDTV